MQSFTNLKDLTSAKQNLPVLEEVIAEENESPTVKFKPGEITRMLLFKHVEFYQTIILKMFDLGKANESRLLSMINKLDSENLEAEENKLSLAFSRSVTTSSKDTMTCCKNVRTCGNSN